MKYELTMSSNRDNTKVNATFKSDIQIFKGDNVLGHTITSRNFILNQRGEIEKIVLDNFEYYRGNNLVINQRYFNPCIGCIHHAQQGLLEGGVEWTCSYSSCKYDYDNTNPEEAD